MRTLLKSLLLLLAIGGLTATPPLSGSELPTVDELRAHLRDYHKNIAYFHIRYKVVWEQAGITKYHDYLMTDTKNYLVSEEWFRPEKTPNKAVRGGDQQTRFHAGYNMPDENAGWILRSVSTENRQSSNVGEMMCIQPFYLFIDQHAGSWFDEHRFHHDVMVLSQETVDDEPCLKVEVNLRDKGRVKHVSRVGEYIWFACEKDYLIKKITPIPGKTYVGAHYHCKEFRHDGERWYPFRGQIGLDPDANTWEVVLFEINKPVPTRTFKAPPKPGLSAR